MTQIDLFEIEEDYTKEDINKLKFYLSGYMIILKDDLFDMCEFPYYKFRKIIKNELNNYERGKII